jgi:hypothetical protein
MGFYVFVISSFTRSLKIGFKLLLVQTLIIPAKFNEDCKAFMKEFPKEASGQANR